MLLSQKLKKFVSTQFFFSKDDVGFGLELIYKLVESSFILMLPKTVTKNNTQREKITVKKKLIIALLIVLHLGHSVLQYYINTISL